MVNQYLEAVRAAPGEAVVLAEMSLALLRDSELRAQANTRTPVAAAYSFQQPLPPLQKGYMNWAIGVGGHRL